VVSRTRNIRPSPLGLVKTGTVIVTVLSGQLEGSASVGFPPQFIGFGAGAAVVVLLSLESDPDPQLSNLVGVAWQNDAGPNGFTARISKSGTEFIDTNYVIRWFAFIL